MTGRAPPSSSNSYLRMLYFSAVTSTTLGYGDIVPIGDIVRMLIIAQTIIGVVIIGFFINSVGRRRRIRESRAEQGSN